MGIWAFIFTVVMLGEYTADVSAQYRHSLKDISAVGHEMLNYELDLFWSDSSIDIDCVLLKGGWVKTMIYSLQVVIHTRKIAG